VRSVSKFTENSNVMFAGDLSSLNRRCLADRKMKFSKKTSSGFKLLDTDRSSANGAWAMKGNLRNNPTVKLQVAKHTHKTGVVCKGREMKISPSNYDPRSKISRARTRFDHSARPARGIGPLAAKPPI
jgi:hypothetical protein